MDSADSGELFSNLNHTIYWLPVFSSFCRTKASCAVYMIRTSHSIISVFCGPTTCADNSRKAHVGRYLMYIVNLYTNIQRSWMHYSIHIPLCFSFLCVFYGHAFSTPLLFFFFLNLFINLLPQNINPRI